MDTEYAASFRHLLQDISDATSRREDPETNYHDLLRKIFEEGGLLVHTADNVPEVADAELLTILEAFGREHEVKELLVKCCNPDEKGIQLLAIPILGAAGMGKTTLARRVYEHESVLKHFEVHAWVKVGGQELSLSHAAQEILKLTMHMTCSIDGLNELDEMVGDALLGERCLVVFDGVESMKEDVWLHMNKNWFNFVGMGSIVLITTPKEDVAYLVSNEPFELKQLLPFEVRPLYRHLSLDTMVIVRGIPLLLTLVVSMMGCHNKLRKLLSQGDFSDVISPFTFDASAVILLCIWALPRQLRLCLAFCAVFPKGYALDRVKVINMWVAHGLVKQSPEENLHNVGESYFHQLLCRSFFTDIARNEYGDISNFQMPGLIHTIMQDVAGVVLHGKVGEIGSISEDADYVSLHSESTGKQMLEWAEDVETLVLSSTLYSGGSNLELSFLYFQKLQSLDLSCSGIRNLSNDICALKELRYLNLSYTLIERLPDSFTELSELQTLDLSWCYNFKVLPKEISNLASMSHLDMSQCESLSYSPSGIGFLVFLTSMPLFVLGKDHDSACLGELGLLNELRGTLEIRNLENVMEISEARSAKLNRKNLSHLVLSWSKDVGNCFEILELLRPNQRLKVFELTGYMGSSFPRWLSSINALIKISITDCACKELPSLGQLPFLKELQLNRMKNLECIDQKFYGAGVSDVLFPSLEQLELYDLPRLFKWSGAKVSRLSDQSDQSRLCFSGVPYSNSVFRSLKTLTVEGCPKLASLPSLPTLPHLIIKNSSHTYTILYSLASFTSLSSLLINDMEVGQVVSIEDLGRWESLKKLVLCNIRDRSLSFSKQRSLTALEHLGILHCHELTDLFLNLFPSLQKLHIIDCPNLSRLLVEGEEEKTQLMELVVEDCPQANANISFHEFHYLRKLILKNCGDDFCLGCARELEKLEKLEFLSISGCLKLESKFQSFPWLISHIPCICLGNHKADFKDSKHLREVSPRDGFSHGPQKSITEQSIHNVMTIKYREIKKATKNFAADMMLGEGGLGTVFKGWIHEHKLTAVKPGSGIAVAVKRWGAKSDKEFSNEVKYMSQLRHPNLVKLIGYCTKKDTRILVYEFVPRGSLDSHLFRRRHESLSWATRINVALGAARALSFLHDLEVPVIHRNVKSGDFLLDGEFNARLSDFGLAKDGPTGDVSHVTTQVMGTHGYTAPEYVLTGHLSPQSDVYGFGVVLLELLSGRAAIDRSRIEEEQNLVQWARSNLSDKNVTSRLVEWAKPNFGFKTKVLRIMDTKLDGQYPHNEAYTLAKLAMQCVSIKPKDRPRMAEVVVALQKLLPKTL